jgi:hypothetical protein
MGKGHTTPVLAEFCDLALSKAAMLLLPLVCAMAVSTLARNQINVGFIPLMLHGR